MLLVCTGLRLSLTVSVSKFQQQRPVMATAKGLMWSSTAIMSNKLDDLLTTHCVS